MRTLRLSLAGAVALALLGGLRGAVVAQAEDTEVNAWVTGVGQEMTGDPSEVEWSETDSGTSGHGFKVVETVEWSGPRPPSEFRSVGNLLANDVGMVFSTADLWEGTDGDWTGQWTGACELADNCWGMTVLTGQGAYEGLSAVIVTMAPEDPESSAQYKGFIFEGELPPMPDPVEPSSEYSLRSTSAVWRARPAKGRASSSGFGRWGLAGRPTRRLRHPQHTEQGIERRRVGWIRCRPVEVRPARHLHRVLAMRDVSER